MCLPVFKTGVGRMRPGWVRFPYALAKKEYKKAYRVEILYAFFNNRKEE